MERKVGTISRGIRCPIIRKNDNLVDINALSSIVYKYENDSKKRPAKYWFFTDEKKDWSIDICSNFINTIL